VIFLIGNEKSFNFSGGKSSLKNQYPTHFPITLKWWVFSIFGIIKKTCP